MFLWLLHFSYMADTMVLLYSGEICQKICQIWRNMSNNMLNQLSLAVLLLLN